MRDNLPQKTVQVVIDKKLVIGIIGLILIVAVIIFGGPSAWQKLGLGQSSDQPGETIDLSNATQVKSIKASSIDTGEVVLTNQDGLTLYVNLNENEFISTCYDDCAQKWLPVILNSGEEVAGPDFSVIVREDESLQAAYLGYPLYTYYKDQQKGDYLGDQVEGVWSAAKLQIVAENETVTQPIPEQVPSFEQPTESSDLQLTPPNEELMQ